MKTCMKFLAAAILAVVFVFGLAGLNTAQAATTPDLGTAGSFAVLGGSTVTNTGSSVITGDLGVSPGSAVTGFPPGDVSGIIHNANATAGQAQTDLTAAYLDAKNQSCDTNLTGQDLGGKILTAGTYCFDSSAGLTGTLTLNAEGNPNAVFIFQINSTLTTESGSVVRIINDAQACKVFWQVGSSATLKTTTDFVGNILALTSITLNTGADIDGRALARNGAVTLDTNDIARSLCAGQAEYGSTEESTDIKVKKTASDYKLSEPDKVTFTYKVTNEGDSALTDISVKDDECDDVDYVSGDEDDDNELDINEEWKYTCKKTVKKTETNTVTAKGTANGEEVKDTDTVKVTVSTSTSVTPNLPNAGIGPDGKSRSLWNIILSTGILATLFSIYLVRKKSAI